MKRTYVWDKDAGELFEVTDFARLPPEAKLHLQTDAGFDGLRATDGTDISSRTKWESYMKARGLTLASDFQGEWAEAAKRREQMLTVGGDNLRRRETLRKVLYEMNPRDVRAIAERARNRLPQKSSGGMWEDF